MTKYQQEYEVYKTLLENNINVCLNLRVYHNSLKVKYGEKFAEVLWNRFIKEYTK